jgi:hypothetical protein
MPVHVSVNDLMDYTNWERQKWFEQLRQRGSQF